MLDSVARKSEISLDTSVINGLLIPILSLMVGILSFGQYWQTIALSLLFPVLYFKTSSRPTAFFTALFYFIGATRALIADATRFYDDDLLFGVIIWMVGNSINAIIYAMLWRKRDNIRIFSAPLAMILTAIPPLGVTGWANPLTAAGVIFPGTSFAGFLYIVGLYSAIASSSSKMIKVFIALSIMCMCLAPKMSTTTKFKGISTNFGKIESDFIGDYGRQQSLIAKTRAAKDQIVVFPEGVTALDWNDISKNLWSRSIPNKTVIIGTSINQSDAEKKDNALVVMTHGKDPDIYRQRQPIPLSMWRPFLSNGYNANWFASPTLDLEDSNTKLAPLICYEGFLVWPVAESVLFGANQIIAVGNFWWTDGKTIPTIHKSIITAWSRLFAIPATLAVNL